MTNTAREHLGQIQRDGDLVGIRYERVLRHPVAKVWRALTESDSLRQWFPTDIAGFGRPGADLTFTFWPETVEYATDEMGMTGLPPVLHGELVTWNPPHELEFRWDTERLHYVLTPDGDGTVLVFTVWLGAAPDVSGVEDPAAGYHVCLDRLAAALDAEPVGMPPASEVHALERRYADAFGSSHV
ncbi:hypothetical protein GOARA_045_00140 [Gordonia araii NBRC 100433]|uniref:Activator of Hsp90 ATPase homologue 1/2-like C-terminal domain-containing protein n=1 Tax=Gordonia araii NBRC 100433 TaxID=1073574 RepID=G7H1D5_9ACTN|nr:SRPBCC domain-containing protein [Gordonia araii]NNG97832.1 hypothetical protein [Gordonia araii NBRC 100433]GAB09660.1 hypothetical protein GOARA_045_00140 [Gordonia araii NBRC 100433]